MVYNRLGLVWVVQRDRLSRVSPRVVYDVLGAVYRPKTLRGGCERDVGCGEKGVVVEGNLGVGVVRALVKELVVLLGARDDAAHDDVAVWHILEEALLRTFPA